MMENPKKTFDQQTITLNRPQFTQWVSTILGEDVSHNDDPLAIERLYFLETDSFTIPVRTDYAVLSLENARKEAARLREELEKLREAIIRESSQQKGVFDLILTHVSQRKFLYQAGREDLIDKLSSDEKTIGETLTLIAQSPRHIDLVKLKRSLDGIFGKTALPVPVNIDGLMDYIEAANRDAIARAIAAFKVKIHNL